MMIDVKVIAGAKKNLIKKENDIFKIYVTQPAIQGKANKALIKLLSEHLAVRKDNISIARGKHSSRKLVEIKQKV